MGNYLIFDGVKTSDYGIVISGEGTYNAPKREVDMFSIPGRNGNFALDKGRFENVEVTYPAANHEPNDLVSFRSNMDGLRNALASRIGYKRLEDTFHPDEYRMAMFKDGLEANMVGQAMASQFDIVFDCKPQRFLKSGGTPIDVTSGDTVTNPTLFESQPLLEIEGSGDIDFNGSKITVYSSALGDIGLTATASKYLTLSTYNCYIHDDETIGTEFLENGDPFTWNGGEYAGPFYARCPGYVNASSGGFIGTPTPGTYITPSVSTRLNSSSWSTKSYYIMINLSNVSFAFGTAQTINDSAAINVQYADGGTTYTTNFSITMAMAYDGAATIALTLNISNPSQDTQSHVLQNNFYVTDPTFTATSSQTPGKLFIDSEIGEAYFVAGDEILNANEFVYMPDDLPLLVPGTNAITYDNTITKLQITPRWWKI